MATPAQIEANRENAQRSSGPRTTPGKRASSRNATKHGLRSALTVAPGEDVNEWEAFQNAVQESLTPKNLIETELANRAASLLWRLRRVSRFENAVLAQTVEAVKAKIRNESAEFGHYNEAERTEQVEKLKQEHADAVELAELMERLLEGSSEEKLSGDVVGWLFRELSANPEFDDETIFHELGLDAADALHYDQLEFDSQTIWRGLAIIAKREGWDAKPMLQDRLKIERCEVVRCSEELAEAKAKLAALVAENREKLALAEGAALLLSETPMNTLTRAEAHLMKQLTSVMELLRPETKAS